MIHREKAFTVVRNGDIGRPNSSYKVCQVSSGPWLLTLSWRTSFLLHVILSTFQSANCIFKGLPKVSHETVFIMATAKPPIPLNAPPGDTTVKVSVIDSTMWLAGITCDQMWNPTIKGFDRVKAGTWSILIEHPSGRKLLYDLGCRKDWENLPPPLGIKALQESGILQTLEVNKNVSEILMEGGMKLGDVEGIIWSHWHFDHTGDPSTFPASTKLIVGQGFKDTFLPGYPQDPKGHVLESDFAGRKVEEIDFSNCGTTIGRFKAFDYFGDGSFYILDSPGHAVGHVNVLCRTHASDAAFIHLGGDSVHHAAEMRPTEYLPLPDDINPSPVPHLHAHSCAGDIFTHLLRNGSKTEHILEHHDPFASAQGDKRYALVYDEPALRDSVRKDEELDAHDNVFTLIAHDWTLKGVIPEWPQALNGWREEGWKEATRWKFLEDFAESV